VITIPEPAITISGIRVKEQLKKMGAFECYHTSFSYTLQDTGEERFVGAPEQASQRPSLSWRLHPGLAVASGGTT